MQTNIADSGAPVTLRTGLPRRSTGSDMIASLKLHARALATPRLTRAWLELLNSNALLRRLAQAQPRLIHKIYRPWLSHRLEQEQRLQGLSRHYRFVHEHGMGELVLAAAAGPVELARLAGRPGVDYAVDLCAVLPLEREGELVFQLRRGSSLVYSVAFAFVAEGDDMHISIGCVQGPPSAGLELGRATTRDLYGWRPRDLLLRLLRRLGHATGCRRMLLVGNANRAVAPRSLRNGKVKADYDSVWRELGALRRADGDYELSCEPAPAPDLRDIPSKRRAEARRRHDLLQDADHAIQALLTPLVI